MQGKRQQQEENQFQFGVVMKNIQEDVMSNYILLDQRNPGKKEGFISISNH